MTPKSAKAKGRRLQTWVAANIGLLLGKKVGPDKEIASREMGQAGPDVRLVGEALHQFPYAVECKYQESWSVHQWIKQARDNMDESVHEGWLIVAKRNRDDPIVIMGAVEFFKLYSKLGGEKWQIRRPSSTVW